MAGTKINEATLRESLKGTENIPIVDTDLPKGRTTAAKLKEYVQPDLSGYALKKEIPDTSGLATKEEVQEVKDAVEQLQQEQEGTWKYALGCWDEEELSPEVAETVGDMGFLAEWHPFLLDTTDNAGKVTHPVGKLKRNNYLRFEDGTFAPTVGITEEQRAQCDVELYLDNAQQQKYCDAGQFNAEAFYNEYGMSQKLYNAAGEEITHILRPWETTETKYTIGIGREDTVYLVDQLKGRSGKVWRGLSRSPKPYDGIDATAYPLKPTAIAPCPSCTVGGKMRNFFFLYEGETNCQSANGQSDLCTMFSNGRTYPRVIDMQQVNNMNYARANNADNTLPYPFAEGGFHAYNAFITAMELLYGTKYLHKDTLFGSGISSNDSCNSEENWKLHGGVRYKLTSAGEWSYATWAAQGDIYYSATQQRTNFSVLINQEYPKEQCMEAQMAASFAVETGVAEGEEFEFYGGTYWYNNPTGVLGLNDGDMNVRVYKKMSQTFNAYDVDGAEQSWDVEVILRMSLIQGMSLSGDVFAYWGGGYEQVGTVKYLQETQRNGNPVDLYLQPDQEAWERETTVSKPDLGTFDFESSYLKVGAFNIVGNGYAKSRNPYGGLKTASGGSLSQGECYYCYDDNYWSNTLNTRCRIAARFRGNATYGYCSARYLIAYNFVSITYRYIAGSAQALIEGATPPQAE